MTLDFRINGQHLSLIGNPFVVAESYDFLEAVFAFSDDWADTTEQKAYFVLGDDTYGVPIIDGAITKDKHINLAAGTWSIYVVGYLPNGDELLQRIPTNTVELYVRACAGFSGGTFPSNYLISYLKTDQTTEQTLTGGVPKLSATRTISNANHLADKKYVDDVADTLLSLDQTTPQEIINGVPTLATDRVIDSPAQIVDKKYVDQYALGGSGFAANLYFTTIDSGVTGYKKISYIAEAAETVLTVPTTTTEALARTYLYDDGLGVTVIDGGKWSATYRARVSSAQGAVIRLVAFLRHTDNSETELFSTTSDKIVNTTYQTLDFQVTQPSFGCLATDRLGFKLYVSTTHPAGVTLYTVVGDGNASYVNTPIALRHAQLRDKNGEADVQHMTAAQISALHSHANKTALDAVSGTNTGDQDVSGAISTHNSDAAAHSGLFGVVNDQFDAINDDFTKGEGYSGGFKISIIVDDNYSVFLTNMKPLLDARSLKCDLAINIGALGQTNYFTSAQVLSLRDDGFGILNHSWAHGDPAAQTLEQLQTNADLEREEFSRLGLDGFEYYVYPGVMSVGNLSLKNVLKTFYKCNYCNIGAPYNSFPIDMMEINRKGLPTDSNGLSTATAYLNQCYRENKYAVLFIHANNIVDNQYIASLLDTILSNGWTITPSKTVVDNYRNVIELGNKNSVHFYLDQNGGVEFSELNPKLLFDNTIRGNITSYPVNCKVIQAVSYNTIADMPWQDYGVLETTRLSNSTEYYGWQYFRAGSKDMTWFRRWDYSSSVWGTWKRITAPPALTTAERLALLYIGLEYCDIVNDTSLGKLVYLKYKNTREVDTLTITNGATSSGNVTVTLNGSAKVFPVTAGMTASQIAASMAATLIADWTATATDNAVVFRRKIPAANGTAPSFSAGATGVTASVAVTTNGAAPTWMDFNDVVV